MKKYFYIIAAIVFCVLCLAGVTWSCYNSYMRLNGKTQGQIEERERMKKESEEAAQARKERGQWYQDLSQKVFEDTAVVESSN